MILVLAIIICNKASLSTIYILPATTADVPLDKFKVARSYLYACWLCFSSVFFRMEDSTDFYDFCILNNEWSYFEKILLLFSWYKNVWDIGICLMNMYNRIFTKNVNNFEMPQQLQQINLRALWFMSLSLKSIMTIELPAQNADKIQP